MTTSIRTLALGVLLGLPAPHGAAATGPDPAPHYDVRLTVAPETGRIRVTGTLLIPASTRTPDTLAFFLHRQLHVSSFGTGGRSSFRVDEGESGVGYLPEARRVFVSVPPEPGEGAAREVAFAYQGTITAWPSWSANVIGAEWTELGLYFPWFPYRPELGPFTYHLEVISAPGYEVVAMGTPRREGQARVFDQTAPTSDIVVVTAPELRVEEVVGETGTLRIAGVALERATIDAVAADVSRIQGLYGAWFGAGRSDILLVASEREEGGGYSRTGGLFLAGLDGTTYSDRHPGYLRYLGHELAHGWWHRADASTWEDWLNEGLAEFCALLVLRELVGPEEFRDRVARKRTDSAGTRPIRGFPRNDPESAEVILYSKAPVLLADLAERMGYDRFGGLTRRLHSTGVANTQEFLDALRDIAGGDMGDWFEQRLDAGAERIPPR